MNHDNRSPRIIETASATTSPDNSNSGSFAYVITAVVLGLALVISLIGAGCASVVINIAASDSSYSDANPMLDLDTYGNGSDDMNWEEFLQYYNDTYGDGGDAVNTDGGSAEVADVLDYDLAPYGWAIDDVLSASAYAGVPSDVREFVRSLVTADRDYTVQVVNYLNMAALNEEARTQNITEAIDLCKEASSAMDAREIPAIADDENGSIKDTLGSAKGKVAQRWALMADEIAMLNTSEEVDTTALWNKDSEVNDATEEAAELLEEAMSQSSQL